MKKKTKEAAMKLLLDKGWTIEEALEVLGGGRVDHYWHYVPYWAPSPYPYWSQPPVVITSGDPTTPIQTTTVWGEYTAGYVSTNTTTGYPDDTTWSLTVS